MKEFQVLIFSIENQYGIAEGYLLKSIYLVGILMLSIFCGFFFKRAIVPLLLKLISHTNHKFDDYLFDKKIFSILSNLIPPFVFFTLFSIFYSSIGEDNSLFYVICSRIVSIYIVGITIKLISRILTNFVRFSKSDYREWNNHYIESIIQFVKIIVYFFAAIIMVAIAVDKNPTTLLAGLGAMATVLLLVFQDSILGLVAGIQLNVNKMLKVGDWIEIRDKGINGIVDKVSLTTIKIKNFDNSIATIPPHRLVSDTFKNWIGIENNGCRQARKTIFIDANSVRFLSKDDIKSLIESLNITEADTKSVYDKIANITMYRKFIQNELSICGNIDSDRWLMVRQLDNTTYGITLEMYFYVKETEFVKFELLTSEIYEYCIAMAPTFGLKIYQGLDKNIY